MNHSRNEMFDSAVERMTRKIEWMSDKFHATLDHPIVLATFVLVAYLAGIDLIIGAFGAKS